METIHTLRPTGINTIDTLYWGYPNIAADCYLNVNEATKSETDYNYNCATSGVQTASVLYRLGTYSGGDAISRIILKGYYKVINTGGGSGARARFRIKTGGTIYEGSFFNPDTAYTLYSKVYTTNPKTGNQWSAAEVNALTAGDSLQFIYTDVVNHSRSCCCQFWVTVVEAVVESGGNFFLVM